MDITGMKKKQSYKSVIACLMFFSLFQGAVTAEQIVDAVSPDGRNKIVFAGGKSPSWSVTRDGKTVIRRGDFGLVFGKQPPPGALEVVSVKRREFDSVWRDRFGGNEFVRDRANETEILFATPEGLRLGVVIRAYDEGVAFRYLIPEQDVFDNFVVTGEKTSFRFAGDPLAWYASYDSHLNSQEGEFQRRSLRSLGDKRLAQLPAVVETKAGYAAICEAELRDWAGAFLAFDLVQRPADSTALKIALSPAPVEAFNIVGGRTPAKSPWRVVILADDAVGLVRNKSIIQNLNPPPEGGEAAFDWVKTGASAWDWWYDSNNDLSTTGTIGKIDFAAEMGWPYHTMDAAWYGRPAAAAGLKFLPRKDLDLKAILAHAKAKGVGILLWVHWAVLEANGVEETFAEFERWGVSGVKIDFLARQDMLMVAWVEKVARLAAKHHLVVNFHAMYHPTGRRRTWPNVLTSEGIRGNEISKWEIPSDAMNPATLVFTRLLAGPGDYTPGGVANVHARDFVCQIERGHAYGDSSPENVAKKIYAEEVGTRAHALALTVAFDSPLMTLCDCPERYRKAQGAELLKDLPAVWRRTVPLAGSIGEYYAVAREAYDGRIYLSVQSVEARELKLPLDFLGEGRYDYTGVTDDPERTPSDANAVRRLSGTATAADSLSLRLDDEGGALLLFRVRRSLVQPTRQTPVVRDNDNKMPVDCNSKLVVFNSFAN